MIELVGITEIVGESSTGKTTVALSSHREKRALYVSSSIIAHSCVPETAILKRIDSFLKLKIFVANDLEVITKEFKVEKIIIDGLDRFLYTLEKPRGFSGDIFRIMKTLRRLCFRDGISVIVINNCYSGWVVEGVTIFNKYLGLPWCYMANSRYLVSRSSCGVRTIRRVLGGEFEAIFEIGDKGARIIG